MFGTSCILGCFGEGPYDNAKGESIWSGATMPTFKQCWEKTWARDSSQNYSFRQFKKTSQNIVLQTKEDPRTQCYKATQLYVESKKPDVVLLEMVKGVLGKKFRKTVFRKWMNMLLGWCFVFYNSKLKIKGLMPSYWGSMVWWMAMVESTTMSTLQCWMHLTLGFPRPDRGCSSSLWGEENRWLHSSFHPHGRKRLIFQWLWTRSSVVGGNADES